MYTSHFPNLTSSVKVGTLKLKNRMCSAPMGFPDLTEDGCLTVVPAKPLGTLAAK